jgi:HEAT repeat protein
MNRSLFKYLALLPGLIVVAAIALVILRPPARAPGRADGDGRPAAAPAGLHLPSAAAPLAERIEAARQLARLSSGDPRSVAFLKVCLRDRDPALRAAALTAFGAIGDSAHIEAVLDRFNDPVAEVRIAAVEAAARMPDPRVTAWLADLVKRDHQTAVRKIALTALTRMAPDDAVNHIVAALDDAAPEVRRAAVDALGALPAESAVGALLHAAMHSDPAVRAAAAKLLGRDARAMLPHLGGALDRSVTLEARAGIARLLGNAGGAETAALLIGLLDGLDRRALDRAGDLKTAVVETLLALGEAVIEPLCDEVVDRETDSLAEQAAAEVFRQLGAASVEPISRRILKWKLFPDPAELKTWVKLLGELGDPRAVDALDRALAQDIPGMAELVAEARRNIETRSGITLPPPAPHAGILHEPPGPLAASRLARARLRFTPWPIQQRVIPRNGVVRLHLPGALTVAAEQPGPQRIDLTIELYRENGAWLEHGRGYALRYNKRDHLVRVLRHSDGPPARLELEVAVLDDNWRAGGFAAYRLEFDARDGAITGVWNGHCHFEPLAGQLTGVGYQLDVVAPGPPPIQPGEFPRMFFRSQDLPVLREKARTEPGRAILRAIRARLAANKQLWQQPVNWVTTWEPGINAAIGHAFLGTLFEDPPHIERGIALLLDRSRTPPYGGEHGERFPAPVIHYPYAYDLLAPHLTPEQRAETFEALSHRYIRFSTDLGPMGVIAANRGLLGVPGLMSLALLREPGPFNLPPPAAPPPVITLSAEPADAADADAPVNALEPGALLRNWLVIGPFDQISGDAALAALGGPEHARPTAGTRAPDRDGALAFAPLPADAAQEMPGLRQAAYIALSAAQPVSVSYLYALVETDTEQAVAMSTTSAIGRRWSNIWINGRPIPDGTIARLQPGRHRVLIEARGTEVSPLFAPANANLAEARQRRHQWLLSQWHAAAERHRQTGELQEMTLINDLCRQGVRELLLDNMGGAGVSSVTAARDLIWPFYHACWVATGDAARPDTPHPLLTSPPSAALSELSGRQLAFAMGFAPEQLRRELAAEFNNRFLKTALHQLSVMELVAAFVNYPLDLDADPQ